MWKHYTVANLIPDKKVKPLLQLYVILYSILPTLDDIVTQWLKAGTVKSEELAADTQWLNKQVSVIMNM
jgi:hypothetical protein